MSWLKCYYYFESLILLESCFNFNSSYVICRAIFIINLPALNFFLIPRYWIVKTTRIWMILQLDFLDWWQFIDWILRITNDIILNTNISIHCEETNGFIACTCKLKFYMFPVGIFSWTNCWSFWPFAITIRICIQSNANVRVRCFEIISWYQIFSTFNGDVNNTEGHFINQ